MSECAATSLRTPQLYHSSTHCRPYIDVMRVNILHIYRTSCVHAQKIIHVLPKRLKFAYSVRSGRFVAADQFIDPEQL